MTMTVQSDCSTVNVTTVIGWTTLVIVTNTVINITTQLTSVDVIVNITEILHQTARLPGINNIIVVIDTTAQFIQCTCSATYSFDICTVNM